MLFFFNYQLMKVSVNYQLCSITLAVVRYLKLKLPLVFPIDHLHISLCTIQQCDNLSMVMKLYYCVLFLKQPFYE